MIALACAIHPSIASYSHLKLSCRKLLGWFFGSEGCGAIVDGRERKLETTTLSQ
jgi:hypothetical protein